VTFWRRKTEHSWKYPLCVEVKFS